MCHLQEMAEQYQDKGLVVLGLNTADEKQIALDFLKENGATFPNIIDSTDKAEDVSFRQYKNSACPTCYLIDREGKIARAWCGYEEGYAEVKAVLKKLGVE
jgi:peroxiredoxin